MRTVPNTVSSRLVPLIMALHPDMNEEQANTVCKRVYTLTEQVAFKRIKEDLNAKEVMTYGVQNALTMTDEEYTEWLKSLRPKRTLSVQTRVERLRKKMGLECAKLGLELTDIIGE